MKTELTLSKPIKITGKSGIEEITTLQLKEPAGDLIFEHGMPYTTAIETDARGGKQRIEIKMDPAIFRAYVTSMTGLADVGQIGGYDLMQLFNLIVEGLNSAGNSKASPTT